jgi:tetratricopeptide (TPR) repeat protein
LLVAQNNLASTYEALGRYEEALEMKRNVYSRRLELLGKEHKDTLSAGSNYALLLRHLDRYDEAKLLLRRTIPVARRVFGDTNANTLRMRWVYAVALYEDPGATLDDLREAVATLEETERISQRVLGNLHPVTGAIENELRNSRAALRARETRETPSRSA